MTIKNKLKSKISSTILNMNVGINNKITNVISQPLISELLNCLKSNKIDDFVANFKIITNLLEKQHPLYPYYKYSVVDSNGKIKLKSIPNDKQALKIYPENFRGKFTIDKKYNNFRNMKDLYDFSYQNQIPIKINIKSIKKFLGEVEDPIQEFKNRKMEEAYLVPKKFPKPKPYRLYFSKGNVSYDYLKIGLKRIEDNTKMIFNNNQQKNSRLFFEIIFDKTNYKNNAFNFSINEKYKNDVKANLQFLEFEHQLQGGNKIVLKYLEDDDVKLEIGNYSITYKITDHLNDKIRFLSKLLKIEKFFNVKLDLSKFKDTEEEYDVLEYLQSTMNKTSIKGKVEYVKCNFGYESNIWNFVEQSKENEYKDNYIDNFTFEENNIEVNIMGVNIRLKKVTHTFLNMMIKDIEKLWEKVSVMEEGDNYQITFVPLDNKSRYEVSFEA